VDEWAKIEASRLLTVVGAIRRVARRAMRNSAYADPLPPARSELLRLAVRRPGLSVAEAAHELRLAPNSVSTMVSQLVTDGLLRRVRADADGRMVRLTITDQGTARVAQWRDLRAELTGRALETMSAADREAIQLALPALARLAEVMEELLSPGGTTPRTPRCTPDRKRRDLIGRAGWSRGNGPALDDGKGAKGNKCATAPQLSLRRRGHCVASDPLADGGTAWRGAAAHRHHTSLRIRKQVVTIGTRRQACPESWSWPVKTVTTWRSSRWPPPRGYPDGSRS
jgi:DNA-binding MarR family transcriptional regulator